MKHEIPLRAATLHDGDELSALLAQLGYPDAAATMALRLPQLLGHPDAELWLAEHAGRVCGFISLHFIPQLALAGDFARISYFCIDEQIRGVGIGAQLEQWASQRALLRGCDRLELHCHSRRLGAHAFYLRQGYEESPKYFYKSLNSQ
jgi:GNAT superfamily N-acetyltransferase